MTENHLVGALSLGMRWLRERNRQKIRWLGTADLADYWLAEGFSLVSEGPCEAVVLGANPELDIAALDGVLDPVLEEGCGSGVSAPQSVLS